MNQTSIIKNQRAYLIIIRSSDGLEEKARSCYQKGICRCVRFGTCGMMIVAIFTV